MIETTLQDKTRVPVMIVSRPGILQQSLRTTLAACRGVAVVASFGDGLTALRQVARLRPELLVIDSNLLDEEVETLLAEVKSEHPAIRCLVLTGSSQHAAQIMAWGADAVVRRDESAQELQSALARLVNIQCGPWRPSEA